jgi:hypothetical protein
MRMSHNKKLLKSTKPEPIAFKPLGADEEYAAKKLRKRVPADELERAVRQECKRIQRIRARSSFFLFRQLYDFLKAKPSITQILWEFYDVLDTRSSFSSRTNAYYAAESLEGVLKDKGEVSS